MLPEVLVNSVSVSYLMGRVRPVRYLTLFSTYLSVFHASRTVLDEAAACCVTDSATVLRTDKRLFRSSLCQSSSCRAK